MNRQEMEKFLMEHFRYDTANSWNAATSYAVRMKIWDFVPRELQDSAFALLDVEETHFPVNDEIREWDRKHQNRWQAGFNGRSGGYLVLYQGGEKPSEHKSYCPSCGQRNFKRVADSGGKCGVCGEKRIDADFPPVPFTWPGRGLDMEKNYSEWDISDLRERVKIVEDFDALAVRCQEIFLNQCRNFTVKEETIMVSKKVKRLVRRRGKK